MNVRSHPQNCIPRANLAIIMLTVKSLNNRHIEGRAQVHCEEVILILEVGWQAVLPLNQLVLPYLSPK